MSFISPGNSGGGGAVVPSSTWAARPSAATIGAGNEIHITDIPLVGGQGSRWLSNGSDFYPVNGEVQLAKSNGGVIGFQSSPQIALQVFLPAGLLLAGSVISVSFEGARFVGTQTEIITRYFGPAGTVADPSFVGLDTTFLLGTVGICSLEEHINANSLLTALSRQGSPTLQYNSLVGSAGASTTNETNFSNINTVDNYLSYAFHDAIAQNFLSVRAFVATLRR